MCMPSQRMARKKAYERSICPLRLNMLKQKPKPLQTGGGYALKKTQEFCSGGLYGVRMKSQKDG